MADETWHEVALPIMEAIAGRELEGRRNWASLDRVCEDTGIDRVRVERELWALMQSGHVEGIDATNQQGFDAISLRLLERGKVAVREWPGDDAYRVLVELVDRRVAEEEDPEERSRFAAFRDALADIGTGAGGNLLAELLRSLG